jgi:hypothetical protein
MDLLAMEYAITAEHLKLEGFSLPDGPLHRMEVRSLQAIDRKTACKLVLHFH